MIELEEIMKQNDQFFYIGDVVLFKIIYTSKRSLDMMGSNRQFYQEWIISRQYIRMK